LTLRPGRSLPTWDFSTVGFAPGVSPDAASLLPGAVRITGRDFRGLADASSFRIRSPDGITSEWLGRRTNDLAASAREDHVPQAAIARPERLWIPMLREKVGERGCLPGQLVGAEAGRAEEVDQVTQRRAL
jgi:hypothetical protein